MAVSYEQLAATATEGHDPTDALVAAFTGNNPLDDLRIAFLCVPALGRGCGTWLTVAELLLIVAERGHRHLDNLRMNEPHMLEGIIDGLRTAAAGILADSKSHGFADPDTCQALETLLALPTTDHGPETGAVIAATAIAHAIDDAHSQSFAGTFAANLQARLRPERAYPVATYNPTDPRVCAESLNTAPERHPALAPPGTKHLRLGGPLHLTYALILDWDMHDRLGPLSGERLRIATCHPHLSLAEFKISTADGKFRNGGPTAANRVEVICAQLATAAEQGANVAIIPEYCLREGDRSEVQSWLRTNHGSLRLVVGGSSEAIDDDHQRVNQYCLWACADGCEPLRKVGSKAFPAEIIGFEEDVHFDRPPIVHIFKTDRWTIATLLCRDAASEELVDLLGQAGVNLLLVPSLSDRVGTIADVAGRLTTATQAFTAVAIGPATFSLDPVDAVPDDMGPEAVFDGPYEAVPSAIAAPSQSAGPRGPSRGIWMFDSYGRSAAWTDTPT